MHSKAQLISIKTLTTYSLLLGLALFVGCQSNSDDETAQKSNSKPKTEEVVAPKTQAPEEVEEKTVVVKTVTPKAEPELPPEPPSSEDLAVEVIKKLGGKAKRNRNDNVVEVDFAGAEITDNDLVNLQAFPILKKLDLTGTPITDAGLKHLRGLEYLQYLYLLGTPITDVGVLELRGHSRLEQLCLDETKVTDKGVAHLAPLGRLVMLHLATQGDITDACIDTLVNLKDLREIKLEGTKVTEDGKARLIKALPKIEFVGGPDGAIPID